MALGFSSESRFHSLSLEKMDVIARNFKNVLMKTRSRVGFILCYFLQGYSDARTSFPLNIINKWI